MGTGAKSSCATAQLDPLEVLDDRELLGRHAADRVGIHDSHALRDRADRVLLLRGRAEFAHHRDAEGKAQGTGDLSRHHDAAARDAEHDGVLSPPRLERDGELSPGIRSIDEDGHGHTLRRGAPAGNGPRAAARFHAGE